MMDLIIGLISSSAVGGAAYYKKSLSGSGFAAAVLVGTTLYAAGSMAWFGTLLFFFLTSSLLSKWKHRMKAEAETRYAKSGRRDAGQVLANGGLGVLLCLGAAFWPHPWWWVAFVGVMATVTADTWATEVGGLSRTAPRSIVSLRPVTPGTSGGITALGLAATAVGGAGIGAAGWLMVALQPEQLGATIPVTASGGLLLLTLGLLGGTIGSLTDSWLGAVCQVMYRCPVCGKDIEKNRHCGAEAVRVRGWMWMTNDAVNALSSAAGGLFSIAVYEAWRYFH